MPSEICRLSCLVVQLLIFLVTLTRAGETIHVNNSAKSSSEIMASSWAIKIPVRDGISDRELQEVAKTIAEETGLSYHGQIGGLRGHFMLVHETFYRESGYNGSEVVNVMKKISQVLERHPEVEWSEQEIVRERFKRSLRFKDQYFPSQWHLNNLQFVGHDINVTGVWEHNITGYGVVVAIVDDGVEWTNPDISENYSFEGSWDLNSNDADPMPRADDVGLNHHGTRCAGEIAAVANTYCAVGVAYGAKVAGIRILDGPMTDSLEAMAFNMNSQINDIYSCSWGPDDNGKTVDGPHQLAQAALAHGVRVGRRGLGSIYVVASGNGGHYKDNCNFDGYANSIYTVTIGAVDESGQMPYYAEHCASMLASTYSSGQGPLRNIVTTDWRLGSGTGCTNRHTGTSAAAPLAAGMLALVLQVRQCLSWRDIQHLIVYAAVKHNVDILDYFTNGAGFHHSHKYGFGLMDSWRLVNLASVWKPVPWMTSWSSPVIYVAKYIPLTTNQLVETYTVKQSELIELATLEHVTLTVNIEHKYRGSVLVSLVSPAGTESKLATERQQDRSSDGFVDWTFSTVRCWGEQASGTWQIIVVNSGLDDDSQGYLRNWRLTLYGSSMTPQEVKERRRLAQDSFNGLHLNSNDTGTCLQSLSPEKKSFFTDRLLTILLLISGFCVLLSVYYMLDVICGTEESPQGSGGLENSEEERKATSGQEETSLNSVLSSDSSLSSLSPVYKKLKADDATRLSHILELGQSFRHQSPNETRSSSRDIDAVSKQSVEKSRTLNVEDEREFEQRLQYAMEQSLVLQETQLKDIERLQEELGKNERVAQPHGITKDRSNIVEKLHKPLKGILKKSSRATKVSK